MRHVLRFLLGVILALACLEVCFRILPVATATHTGYYVAPTILTYPPHHTFTVATGWDLRNAHRHKANNFGFLADHEFVFDPQAIGLVGDSFVEANMLSAPQRLAAQLETKLNGRPVYALGGPGSSILDYAERIRFASESFGIQDFVIVLERGDLKQALCGSGHNHGPCLDASSLEPRIELQAAADWKKRLFRESALAQYLFSQLKISPAAFWAKMAPKSTKVTKQTFPSEQDNRIDQAATAHFFKQLLAIPRPLRLIFVTDADRMHLSDPIKPSGDPLQFFRETAVAKGYAVIQPDQAFIQFKHQYGLVLEVGANDAHWNPEATKIVADLIAVQFKGTSNRP